MITLPVNESKPNEENLQEVTVSKTPLTIEFSNLENNTSLKFYSDANTTISIIQKNGVLLLSLLTDNNNTVISNLSGFLGQKISSMQIPDMEKIKQALEFTEQTIHEHKMIETTTHNQKI